MSWFTRSKALDRSRNKVPTISFLSIAEIQLLGMSDIQIQNMTAMLTKKICN